MSKPEKTRQCHTGDEDEGETEGIVNPSNFNDANLSDKTTDPHDVKVMTEAEIRAEKKNIIKNILLISFAFLFNFNAFQGLSRLQSSLHRDQGMGTTNSAVLYAALMLSSLVVPNFMISYIGYKWTIPLSMTGYILWMAANGYAVWGTMVTASILVGLCAAPLWTAQKSYFTIVAIRYAKLTGEEKDGTVAWFLGIFFCIYQFSSVSGSIISSTVLRQPANEIDDEILQYCGSNDCPGNNASNPNAEKPPQETVWIMLGIYIVIAVVGVIIVSIFVDELPKHLLQKREQNIKKETIQLLTSTVKLLKHPKMLALIPLTMYTGFEQGAFNAEFTKSFVTCSMGIWQVGFVTIPYGIVNALTSFACGRLTKYTGRIPLFTAGFLVDYAIQIVLVTWMPTPQEEYVMYIIAMMWGFTDAMWQTLLNAMFGVIFDDPVPAFANDGLWGSAGFVIAFAYSEYLCTDVKLFILVSVLSVSAVGYYIAEYLHKQEIVAESQARQAQVTPVKEQLPFDLSNYEEPFSSSGHNCYDNTVMTTDL